MLKEKIRSLVAEKLETAIAGVFEDAHSFARTTDGDFLPEQEMALETLQEQLTDLITEGVWQNTTAYERSQKSNSIVQKRSRRLPPGKNNKGRSQ